MCSSLFPFVTECTQLSGLRLPGEWCSLFCLKVLCAMFMGEWLCQWKEAKALGHGPIPCPHMLNPFTCLPCIWTLSPTSTIHLYHTTHAGRKWFFSPQWINQWRLSTVWMILFCTARSLSLSFVHSDCEQNRKAIYPHHKMPLHD